MFIQTESTPNPNAIKFMPDVVVMDKGTAMYSSAEEAKGKSQLAVELLEMDEVESVFFGLDFITVTKKDAASWDVVKPLALTMMMEHLLTGQAVQEDEAPSIDSDDPVVQQIRELIETRVRPAVAQDGGDIIFRGFVNGVVQLTLRGACSSCPSSTMTLKNGVENMLKYYVPEVTAVEAVA
ncbi:NifU family protein [bacterium]|nr:NifU family protein [bacterium]